MRPINFRAYHKYLKEMLIPEQCLFNRNGSISSFSVRVKDDDGQYIIKNEDETLGLELMQFTGLLDKNGKECYEGDIVITTDSVFSVKYDDENGAFVLCRYGFKPMFLSQVSDIKIIGNLYENPELLTS